MPFNLQPTVQNRAGELIGAGISGAGQSIADAITATSAKRDELKGYQQILKAAAADPNNGIDPDSIGKMSLADAKGTIASLEIRKATAQAKQQQVAQGGLAAMLATMGSNQRPIAAPAGAGLPGTSPAVKNVMYGTPGMNLRDAIINAATRNPAALKTDLGSKLLSDALTTGLKAPPGNPQIDPSGHFYMSDTGWKPMPRQIVAGNGAGLRAPGTAAQPGEKYQLPLPPKGGYYETLKTKSGREMPGWIGVYDSAGNLVDARQDPQAQPRAASGGTSTRNGLLSFGRIQADAMNDETNAPAAGTSGPEIGAVVKGYTFLGGDPADQNSWEKVPSADHGDSLPTITSQSEYDALESGAQYRDSSGNVLQKK